MAGHRYIRHPSKEASRVYVYLSDTAQMSMTGTMMARRHYTGHLTKEDWRSRRPFLNAALTFMRGTNQTGHRSSWRQNTDIPTLHNYCCSTRSEERRVGKECRSR